MICNSDWMHCTKNATPCKNDCWTPNVRFGNICSGGTQLAQILADTAQRHAIGENRINSAMQAFESFSYDEVIALFRESERLGMMQAASSAYAQGLIEEDAVNWREALTHYNRAYDLDATLEHQKAYARLCWQMGRWEVALPLYKDILEQVPAEHGKAGNEYATALNNLAMIYHDTRRYEDAEPLYDEALSISRRVLGADHPETATSLNKLAGLYRAQGRYVEAAPMVMDAVEIMERVLGAEHPNTKIMRKNYEVLLAEMKQ